MPVPLPVALSAPMRSAVATIAYGIVLTIIAAATLHMVPMVEGTVLVWPVNAIAVAVLTRHPPARWAVRLAVTLAALLVANLSAGIAGPAAAGYALVDLAEIMLVGGLICRTRPDPRLLRGYATVVAVSIVGAAAGALSGALLRTALDGATTLRDTALWFAGNAVGLVVLLPALKATRRALSQERRFLSPTLAVPAVASLVLSMLVFGGDWNLPLFVLLPCGVFAALLYRFAGAAVSTLTIAIVAVLYTLNGVGPFVAIFATMPDRILFLQLFVAVTTLTAFPVAALLYEQSLALDGVRDNERQFRLLTDHSSDLIVRIGPDCIRRYASPASQRLLGYPPEALVGQSSFDLIHPDDRDRVGRLCQSLSVDGDSDSDSIVIQYRQRHRDGHYVWLEGAFRMVGGDGDGRELIGSIRDLGRREGVEYRAIESAIQIEERHRLLAMAESAAQIGHWRLGLADRRLLWSPEVFRIHGHPPGEEPPLGDAIDYYHPEDRAMVREQIDRAIATGGSFAFEARLVRPDGGIRWVASRGQAERVPGAGVVGLFGVFQDTTEQVAAMADLRAAREEAERALAAKATFTATMSHEIRTPLTSILAAVQLLRDTPDRTERMRHLDSLEQAGRTLSDIVDDVLTFSKLEGGHGDPEAIAFAPRELMATVAGMFAVEAQAHDLSLDLDVPAARVIGDPARVQRVLTNLVGNAVKFTRAGSIRLTASPIGDDQWRFEVADTGVGIRRDRLEAIFEPFVQADASTTRSYGGTGLGLSISRMLVESMHGTIGVASRPGDGSRFWFILPLAPAGSAGSAAGTATTGTPDAAAADRARSCTVLVAEDNDTNRYLIAEIVRRQGHQVVAVENGARAVEYATAAAGNPLDIVLMDVQMPVMDGIAATRAIRAWSGAGATVPIYALTADQSAERRAEILRAGMNGVLTKPVDVAALRSVLDDASAPGTAPSGTAPAGFGAIDPARIRALHDALGAAQRDTLLALLIEDATRVPGRLRTLAEHGRINLARREAHALRGAAASMGAGELVAALQVIEGVGDDDRIDPAALATVERCAAAVIAAARAAMDDGA